jgi:hypothetical protein
MRRPAAKQQALLGLRAMHRAGAKQYAPGSQLADAVKDYDLPQRRLMPRVTVNGSVPV